MVKTWFHLCSVYCACTQCRCMLWFALGLCSGFGSVFNLGFCSALGLFPKHGRKTATPIVICGWSGMLYMKING